MSKRKKGHSPTPPRYPLPQPDHVPPPAVSPPSRNPPKRPLFGLAGLWRRSKWMAGCAITAMIAGACLCLLVGIGFSIELGWLPDLNATENAERTATRIAQRKSQIQPSVTTTDQPTQQPSSTVRQITPEDPATPGFSRPEVVTVKPSATATPSPSKTSATVPTITVSPSPSRAVTAAPSSTPTTPPPTLTRTPSPVPTMRPQDRYVTTGTLNVRRCVGTNCAVIGQLEYGDPLRAIYQDKDAGGQVWYGFMLSGEIGWVAGWLTSTTRPAVVQPSAPQAPAAPAQQPAASAVAPAAPAFTCNCSKTCQQMASCEEAYFQLQQCGCTTRDRDRDGVPCEDICPGG